MDNLDEKVHAGVVSPDHYSVPNNLSWQVGHAHHFACGDVEESTGKNCLHRPH
jgi:hypothetical protein